MRITSITYRRLNPTDKFANEAVEVTASVSPNEDPHKVFSELKEFVLEKLKIK